MVFVAHRVAIFVDGCFWHRCPLHFRLPVKNRDFWAEKIGRNVIRDRQVDKQLEDSGWVVLRIWEHEIESMLDECVQRVVLVLKGTLAESI